MLTKRITPVTHLFADDGRIPNNPKLPLVLYRGGIDLAGSPDPELLIEKTFADNGWGDMWRNGIYPYAHYHSMIHEVMAIARGRAKVRFGGEQRRRDRHRARRRRHPAGRHRASMPQAQPRPRGHRRLSAERQIQSLPRHQGRARQGGRRHPQSAAAVDRSGVRAARTAIGAVAGMSSGWLTFWDSSHSIYVNARHRDVHYSLIAQQIAALVPSPQARVLDYGCGEALHADRVAAAAGELLLCEGAPRVRAGIAARFAGNAKIRAVAPEDVERLADHSLDLIVLHSVAQYLTPEELAKLFALFHRLLNADGVLVVSDVIPPDVAASTDALALLRFGAANGFFIAAVTGLVRTVLSDYWRLRTRYGLTRYGEAAMTEKLAAAGFAAQRAAHNIGHNQARMAFMARPR